MSRIGWHSQRRTKPALGNSNALTQERTRQEARQCQRVITLRSSTSVCSSLTPLSGLESTTSLCYSFENDSLAPPSMVSNQSSSFQPYQSTRPTQDDPQSDDDDGPGAYALTRVQDTSGAEFDEEWDPTDPSHARYEDDNTTQSSMSDQDGLMNTRHRPASMNILDADVSYGYPKINRWYRSQQVAALIVSLLFVLGAAIVAVILLKRGKGDVALSGQKSTEPGDCSSFSSVELEDPVLQCRCFQTIFKLKENVQAEYEALKRHGALFGHVDNGLSMNSCLPENFALLWIATETVSSNGRSMTDLQLTNRYVLSVLYAAWGGGKWKTSSGWLSDLSECTWHGIKCDDNGHITSISLTSNNLVGSLESRMGLLKELRVLELNRNNLRGTIPTELWSLQHIEEISIGDNKIGGGLPENLGNTRSLTRLSMFHNQLSGIIPDGIAMLTNLRELNMHSSKFSGSTIPRNLGALTILEILDLSNSGIIGSVPESVTLLSNLRRLHLQLNELTGGLPDAIVGLTNLVSLDLGSNGLTATIPTGFGEFSNLVHMGMQFAKVAGTIPSELGRCTNLLTLLMSGNDLIGTLPTELGKLTKLEELTIGVNPEITGTIPSQFEELNQLIKFHLWQTAISGTVPELCRVIKTDSNGCPLSNDIMIPESVEMCSCCKPHR